MSSVQSVDRGPLPGGAGAPHNHTHPLGGSPTRASRGRLAPQSLGCGFLEFAIADKTSGPAQAQKAGGCGWGALVRKPCACPGSRPSLAPPCGPHTCLSLLPLPEGCCSQLGLKKGRASGRKIHPHSREKLPLKIQNKLHIKWSEKHNLSPRCREPGRPLGSRGWIHSPRAVEVTVALSTETGEWLPFWLITIKHRSRPAKFCRRNSPPGQPVLLPAGSEPAISRPRALCLCIPACSLTRSFPGHSRPNRPPLLSRAAPRGLLGQPSPLGRLEGERGSFLPLGKSRPNFTRCRVTSCCLLTSLSPTSFIN